EGEVAICGARCERRREPVLVRPEDVEIEVRGAGNATRQINHILKPEFPAERLLVVEVFTPSGNWSSYPPHKHDEDDPPGEVVLEETYYFKSDAFAVQKLYSPRHGLGRSSGRPTRVPVSPVGHGGARYLVSARGESNGVRNLRAAGRAELKRGSKTQPVRVTELPVEERPPVIAAYRKVAGREVERYFKKLPDPTDHPVFRLDPT